MVFDNIVFVKEESTMRDAIFYNIDSTYDDEEDGDDGEARRFLKFIYHSITMGYGSMPAHTLR